MFTLFLSILFQGSLASADSSVLAPARATMDFKAAPAPKSARRGPASVADDELPPEIDDAETEAHFEVFCETCSPQKAKTLNDHGREIAREVQKGGG